MSLGTEAPRRRRRRDPLEARREALIEQGTYTVLQVSHTAVAVPWLAKAGYDAATGAVRLREIVETARGAERTLFARRRAVRVAELFASEELPRVRAWRVSVRAWLKNAAKTTLGPVAAGKLRAPLAGLAVRHRGTMIMLQGTFRVWDEVGPALGEPELGAELRQRGGALLARLETLAERIAEHKRLAAGDAVAANAAEQALRAELIEVRGRWASARSLAPRVVPELDLWIGAADVGGRGRRKNGAPPEIPADVAGIVEAPNGAGVPDVVEGPVEASDGPTAPGGTQAATNADMGDRVTVLVAVSADC